MMIEVSDVSLLLGNLMMYRKTQLSRRENPPTPVDLCVCMLVADIIPEMNFYVISFLSSNLIILLAVGGLSELFST